MRRYTTAGPAKERIKKVHSYGNAHLMRISDAVQWEAGDLKAKTLENATRAEAYGHHATKKGSLRPVTKVISSVEAHGGENDAQ